MNIEKTINDSAIFINVVEGSDKNDLDNLLDFSKLEKDAIILDFTNTKSINSSFISGLIKVYESCIINNVKFVISGTNEISKTIFDNIGISKIMKI